MRLTKQQRSALRERFDGRCAYCGADLGDRWHADHVEPVRRTDWMRRFGVMREGPDHPERDTLANLLPACAPCNIDKHSFDLETWRAMVGRRLEVLRQHSSAYRHALRFGLVKEQPAAIVFYFERAAQPPHPAEGS
jgi:hypothetical protein